MAVSLNLRVVPGSYGIARLDSEAALPAWAGGEGFWTIIRADDEMTVVCLQDRIPDDIQSVKGWACLRTVGPFAFNATGIVSALIAPLSAQGIGVFVVCTYDGEHLLVSERDMDRSKELLVANGHSFVG